MNARLQIINEKIIQLNSIFKQTKKCSVLTRDEAESQTNYINDNGFGVKVDRMSLLNAKTENFSQKIKKEFKNLDDLLDGLKTQITKIKTDLDNYTQQDDAYTLETVNNIRNFANEFKEQFASHSENINDNIKKSINDVNSNVLLFETNLEKATLCDDNDLEKIDKDSEELVNIIDDKICCNGKYAVNTLGNFREETVKRYKDKEKELENLSNKAEVFYNDSYQKVINLKQSVDKFSPEEKEKREKFKDIIFSELINTTESLIKNNTL